MKSPTRYFVEIVVELCINTMVNKLIWGSPCFELVDNPCPTCRSQLHAAWYELPLLRWRLDRYVHMSAKLTAESPRGYFVVAATGTTVCFVELVNVNDRMKHGIYGIIVL